MDKDNEMILAFGRRVVALTLAVWHGRTTAPSAEKCIAAAEKFEKYLEEGGKRNG